MERLEEKLNHHFSNRTLLAQALTHSSYANENRKSGAVCNERLEYLGDAVLDLVVGEYFYRNFPKMPEGEMSRLRAELVCEASLVLAAERLELSGYLRLGKGEESNGGRNRPSILADAVEAVLAAVYLDCGLEKAREIVNCYVLVDLKAGLPGTARDAKTALQEFVQRKSGQTITYALVSESGPDHNKRFTVEVSLNGKVIGVGEGRSKKEAEQAAASLGLESLNADA